MFEKTLREIRAEYYTQVRLIAEEIADELNLQALEDIDRDEDIRARAYDLVYEMADGSPWVFEYFRASLVAIVSDNADAADDPGLSTENDCQRAYYSMSQDIFDLLYNEYFYQDLGEKRRKKRGAE